MKTTKIKSEKELIKEIVASFNDFRSMLLSEKIKKGLARKRRSKMASKPPKLLSKQ